MKYTPDSIILSSLSCLIRKNIPKLLIIHEILGEKGFISKSSILEEYTCSAQNKIQNRLQQNFNLFAKEYNNNEIVKIPDSPLQGIKYEYNECYYTKLLKNSHISFKNVKCPVKRDRCEIPLGISPVIYTYSQDDITFVYNVLRKKNNYIELEDFEVNNYIKLHRWKKLFDDLHLLITSSL